MANNNETGYIDLSFGEALTYLKSGFRICREGWHGKNMYAYIDHFKFNGVGEDQEALVLSLPMGNRRIGWLPSVEDLLADDWHVLKEEGQA